MKNKIEALLAGHGENHILPFFWQHGEDEETLRDMMRAINECGIGAVCVECRPHPDFCGPKWWEDMDIIMDEARKRNMKVWLLDDAHFPTGYANGAMKTAPVEKCKQYLAKNTTDVVGPNPEVEIQVSAMARYIPNPFDGAMNDPMAKGKRTFDDDELLCVLAVLLRDNTKYDPQVVDLTGEVENGVLRWSVPNGTWRIHVIYKTRNGPVQGEYINMIDEESCRILIDQVHEPHYARYKDDFGKTFVGFFSDEPCLGNTLGFNWTESIGRHHTMHLPWNKDVPGMLEERLGKEWVKFLPALWFDCSDDDTNAKARYAYMDTVTRLVEKNFSRQIGDWCQAHGVEYIGHVVEDNNQHSRLGSSLGHFYRSMAGQHMAGIDNIGGQVLPNGEDHTRRGLPEDGEFYHFALGKLGSSLGHIDPRKKGRTMCEIFGAYGWSESVPMMKYIADHFLVRGVNNYVPHAFTAKSFPDSDCPPHFYAHGENPQYRHFGKLCRYMNRVSDLISDGVNVSPAALLYHGEAEWTGDYMYLQKPARVLHENQIDFEIIPSDVFSDMDAFCAKFDGKLHVNGATYQALIVPYAQYITADVARFAAASTKAGFPVVFINALPEGVCNAEGEESEQLLDALADCTAVPLNELVLYLRNKGIYDIEIAPWFRRIRYYHYQNNGNLYMLTNEDAGEAWSGTVTLPISGPLMVYDAMENVMRPLDTKPVANGTQISITLEPYKSLLITDAFPNTEAIAEPKADGAATLLEQGWTLSLAESKEYPNFHDKQPLESLKNIGTLYPDFSGFMRYETDVDLAVGHHVLEASDVYDCAELYVNGTYAGMRICPPYRWDISDFVKDGQNSICIDIANTLDRKVRSFSDNGPFAGMSAGNPLSPSGLMGTVKLYSK